MAVENDERGPVLRLAEDPEGVLDAIDIVGITNAQNVPPVAQEPGRYVLGEGDTCVAFDGDVVVVVDPAEIVEPQVGGQRRRFRRDALHHAPISTNSIDLVIEDLEPRPVVTIGEPFLSDCHPYTRGDSLSERLGCSLDPR